MWTGTAKRIGALLTAGVLAGTATVLGAEYQAEAAPRVTKVSVDRARYAPGQPVTVTAQTQGNGEVTFSLKHLGKEVDHFSTQASADGKTTWTFTPPQTDFTGYLVEVDTEDSQANTAIDVSSTWTRYPRFGYLGNYSADLSGKTDEIINQLAQDYHINSLQYYDWMWRHEDPVRYENSQVAAQWSDWKKWNFSSDVIKQFITSGDKAGVASLPYSMSYAALEGYQDHGVSSDWAINIRGDNDTRVPWTSVMIPGQQDTTLHMMNPQNTQWRQHMVDQYKKQIELGFEGTHIDQLGNPQGAWDVNGNPVDLEAGFASLVNETSEQTKKPVGLNAVDGYGSSQLAQSKADYLYTELWGGQASNSNLADYLERQRKESGGKSAVVAAYMNSDSVTGDRYEAEDASHAGLPTASDHEGYTGKGFVEQPEWRRKAVSFNVNVTESRNYGLVLRWANATGRMAVRSVYVDGTKIGVMYMGSSPTHFSDNSDIWTRWSTGEARSTWLDKGQHTITYQFDEGDYGDINVDSLTVSSFDTPSVQLADAVFAANGAHHLELGQDNNMLNGPFFPDRIKFMSYELQDWLRNYYNVITGYENVLYGPELHRVSRGVSIQGHNVSSNGSANTIWANAMTNGDTQVLHLINLEKDNDGKWRDPTAKPETLLGLPVSYTIGDGEVPAHLYAVSPDVDGGRAREIPFTVKTNDQGQLTVNFTADVLSVWDFFYTQKDEASHNDGGNTDGHSDANTPDNTPSTQLQQGALVNGNGKCLDLWDGASLNGRKIQEWDCARTTSSDRSASEPIYAQNVTFDQGKLMLAGKCLDIFEQRNENGTPIHLWDCVPAPTQEWRQLSGGQLQNVATGKCLAVREDSSENGTVIHLWDCHSGQTEKWSFKR